MIDTVEDAQGPELILTHKLGNEETQDRHILEPNCSSRRKGAHPLQVSYHFRESEGRQGESLGKGFCCSWLSLSLGSPSKPHLSIPAAWTSTLLTCLPIPGGTLRAGPW